MITHHEPSNICLVTDGVIVHGCNAQGVMGSGVAKQLRAKYPDIFLAYINHLDTYKGLDVNPLGSVSFSRINGSLLVANAITQEFYGRDGELYVSYIALIECLKSVAEFVTARRNMPVHIPYLIGAGLGGGDEEKIIRIIENKLKDCDVHLHHWK